MREVARRIAGVIAGARDDLGDLDLDLASVPSFHARVYAAARKVAPERPRAWRLARQVGITAARAAVGVAMARNPVPIIVPCHRVLGADGAARGFGPRGVHTKAVPREEGVRVEMPDVPRSP
ncbi:MAG: methylated-DNA--[protein]-cysteine S-methyltransferase [Polyangiales bacterium]